MAELKKIIVDGVEYTLPEGGGGGVSSVFEDVDALPTENINSDVIYSLLKVFGIINQYIQTNPTVHIVDTLPTTGNVCTSDGSNLTDMYYNRSDNNVYGYLDDTIGSAFGIAAGWYNAGTLLGVANMSYGGVVDSIVGLEEDTYYFVREYDLYVYKGKWIKLDNDLVFQGEGESAVVMNYLGNVASGDYSHVEGADNTASGYCSHAEGQSTTASGSRSHAEGASTTASGYAAHAEGYITTASGDHSHAEGVSTVASGNYSHAEGHTTESSGDISHAEGAFTTASGDRSHAEGNCTTASSFASHAEGCYTKAASQYQHVQGKYNIEDTEDKYAHIVGNGSSDTARSNAHTLDWDGNAWFKGKVRVGGTSWDDATELGGGGVVFTSTITGTLNQDGVLALDTTSSSFIFNTADYIINNFDKIKAITLIIENNILGNYVISPVFAGGSTVGGETIVYKNFQFTIADSETETGICILRIYNINECTLSYSLSNFVQYFSGSVFTFKILI